MRKTDFSKLWFSRLKKFPTRSVFGELQLIQISLSFETSFWSKTVSGFSIMLNKNINFNKNETESKMEKKSHKESQIKSKTVISRSLRKKKKEKEKRKRGHFLYCLFCQKKIFLTFVFYLNVYCIEYTFRINTLLQIKKHYFIQFICF